MQFRLTFQGLINANANSSHKWKIRQGFEPQLRRLWNQIPLLGISKYRDPEYRPNNCYVGITRHNRSYIPIISSKLSLYAELDVLLLSSSKPGNLLHAGGDIDNRLKTLFDALTVPTEDQSPPPNLNIPRGNFDCLLEDDKLVRRVSVESDQLLTLDDSSKEVLAIINVSVKLARGTMGNLGLVS
jgi:hypothetical protein